jgi:fibronectin type 3 domain-containing protein
MLLGIFLLAGCSTEIDPPSSVSSLPQQPEIPRGLSASIGDGTIELSWTISTPAAISKYMIYFTDDADAEPVLLDSSTTNSYAATGLTNGRAYFFSVASVSTGNIEGVLSSALSATPGIFSININQGALYANSRNITVGLTAPAGTNLVQLSESSLFTDAHWDNFSGSKNYTLSDGDGVKQIYARFQLSGGGASTGTISDDITLDRVATIDSVTENSLGAVLGPGSTVQFIVYTSEAGGAATVTVSGIGTLDLSDSTAGIYTTEYTLPIGIELVDAEVVANFTDAAGNNALETKATTLLNATDSPEAVTLTGFAESSLEITLEWTASNISDFSSYRIFRDVSTGVDETSDLVTTINNQGTLSYQDTDLDENTEYFYVVYVYDRNGNSAASNEDTIQTLVNEAPDAVSIAVTLTGESLSSMVSWGQSDAEDFQSYHIMRSENNITVYDSDDVISIVNDQSTTSLTDFVPSATNYFYQVYVVDKQGLMTGSNVISIVIQ